ncbi:hypothetical protein ACFL1T_02415 [Chlamydiota bacterium]
MRCLKKIVIGALFAQLLLCYTNSLENGYAQNYSSYVQRRIARAIIRFFTPGIRFSRSRYTYVSGKVRDALTFERIPNAHVEAHLLFDFLNITDPIETYTNENGWYKLKVPKIYVWFWLIYNCNITASKENYCELTKLKKNTSISEKQNLF